MKAMPIPANTGLQTGTEQRPDESVIHSFPSGFSRFVLRGSQETLFWADGRE
jgi:hypothetical protein